MDQKTTLPQHCSLIFALEFGSRHPAGHPGKWPGGPWQFVKN
jgi:hypothetical protein